MFVKEVVLDGFKSYAQRTVISGWDPLFNAITGLNGSGKSNILDSICFVLGITNLSQVRAGNLQELVYKQGQAGVTKATVSIVFDNSDKAQSPVGYEQHDTITVTRQVVIGGRNKYLVNGHNSTPSRVQNLFHSVQLNVNNPHFLIMQGRITKVLNMKPQEILSMIEEAAGTRMYETKKIAARKTMEKKDSKINEIATVLNEDITPTLEKLRGERSSYLEYQKISSEIEFLLRYVVAWKFLVAQEMGEKSAAKIEEAKEKLGELKGTVKKSKQEIANLNQNIEIIQKKKDIESMGSLKEMESSTAELSKEYVKADATLKNMTEQKEAAVASKAATIKSIKETEKSIVSKDKEILAAKKNYEAKLAVQEERDAEFKEEERNLTAVTMGMSTDESGCDKTFADQLKDAKEQLSVTATAAQQAEMKIKHHTEELKKKRPAAKGSEKEHAKMQATLEKSAKEMDKLKKEMDSVEYDPAQAEALHNEKIEKEQERANLRDQNDSLTARFSNLEFTHEGKFKPGQIHGIVASLVELKDPKTSTALEVAAGGRLYNVVVDNEVTGKELLSKGKLKRRVTIIPLNKINSRTASSSTVQAAKKEVGEGNVDLALSLVGYEKEVSAAMAYVFGSTLICKTMDQAKKVTFNDRIRTKSVTLDGDVFDPSGSLTGGAAPSNSGVLEKLLEMRNIRERLATVEARLKEINSILDKLSRNSAKYNQLSAKYEVKKHEEELLKQRVAQSTHFQALEELRILEAQLVESTDALKGAKENHIAAEKKIKTIEGEMKKYAKERDSRLKAAEKAKAKAKVALTKAKESTTTAKQAMDEVVLEKESLQAEIIALEQQIGEIEASIEDLQKQEDEHQLNVEEQRLKYEEADQRLQKKKEKLSGYSDDIAEMAVQVNALTKTQDTAELELKKMDHKITKLQKDNKDAAKTVEHMLTQHDWIATEKQYFGIEGTAFDFNDKDPARNPARCQKRLAELQATQAKLAKKVNMKVLSMFDKAEKEYNTLLKKKVIVEQDKAKIEQAIHELDEKKNEALKKAYEQVNKDFGSIFSTLLPGTNAKLSPVEGMTVLDGLRVRVAFGQVWKESLNELSGGQRSLVALSLILSLLLFKPAPLYILDEVDAALDLSHTQNIGQMLRTHFNKSQFIVVSLKDGMFNNANVLFKTKFVDGVSTVKRFTQTQSTITSGKENAHSKGKGKKASKSSSRTAMSEVSA